MADKDFYEAADSAIWRMDRDNLREFNKLKLADFDRISVVRTVLGLYRKQTKKARKEYRRIGMEAYLFALFLAETEFTEAESRQMVREAITDEWIDGVLHDADFVTLYRFSSETERKARKLIEGIAVTSDDVYVADAGSASKRTRSGLIDSALKAWTGQLAQYAINVTDYAMMQAFEDAGVKEVEWVDAEDQRVCAECHSRDGKVYKLEEAPPKPHIRCRCRLMPVIGKR